MAVKHQGKVRLWERCSRAAAEGPRGFLGLCRGRGGLEASGSGPVILLAPLEAGGKEKCVGSDLTVQLTMSHWVALSSAQQPGGVLGPRKPQWCQQASCGRAKRRLTGRSGQMLPLRGHVPEGHGSQKSPC